MRLSEEHRAKIAAARTGNRHSKATREKMRASHARRSLEAALFRAGARHGEPDLDVDVEGLRAD